MDAHPDLEWHVAEAETAGRLDHAGLRELAGALLAERLDHERPLWRMDVAPLDDGGTALIVRVHHAMADGVTAIRLVGELLWILCSGKPPSDERGGRRRDDCPAQPLQGGEAGRVAREEIGGALRRELRRARTPSSTATSAPTARSPGGPSLWRA